MFFVFSNPVAGQDREFNDWYDNVHVHEVVAVPGITAAQRYTLDDLELPDDGSGVSAPAHRYLTVYEVDIDAQTAMKSFLGRLESGDMTLSPALDMSSVSMGFWSPSGPRVTPD